MSGISERSWQPERGVDPLYVCPDCSYSRTGTTTSRHRFRLHLLKEHEYSVEDATRVLSRIR